MAPPGFQNQQSANTRPFRITALRLVPWIPRTAVPINWVYKTPATAPKVLSAYRNDRLENIFELWAPMDQLPITGRVAPIRNVAGSISNALSMNSMRCRGNPDPVAGSIRWG